MSIQSLLSVPLSVMWLQFLSQCSELAAINIGKDICVIDQV